MVPASACCREQRAALLRQMPWAEPGVWSSPWGFASAEEAEKHSRGSEEQLYPHMTFYLLPDFTGSPFLASLSQGSVLLGKDQMLPVCTCFAEVFPFVWRILFEARKENSFDCCLLDYFEAVGLREGVQSLIRGFPCLCLESCRRWEFAARAAVGERMWGLGLFECPLVKHHLGCSTCSESE